MEIIPPSTIGYTIYTKKDCIFCDKVKKLLETLSTVSPEFNASELSVNPLRLKKENNICIIPCDEYLQENKEEFLYFIEDHAGLVYKTFPMVFLDGIFIGGFTETKKLIEMSNIFITNDEF